MSGPVLLTYVGLALAYAGALSLVGLGAAKALGARAPGRFALLLVLVLFFVFLALHPFPDRATLDCRQGGVPAQLVPFHFIDAFRRLAARGAGPMVWLRDISVTSSVMNFVVCAAIGAALSRHVRHLSGALVFAVLLTGGIETAQLTGLFWLYPCPYRHFEVDDLILNVAGTVAGFLLARGLRRRGG